MRTETDRARAQRLAHKHAQITARLAERLRVVAREHDDDEREVAAAALLMAIREDPRTGERLDLFEIDALSAALLLVLGECRAAASDRFARVRAQGERLAARESEAAAARLIE